MIAISTKTYQSLQCYQNSQHYRGGHFPRIVIYKHKYRTVVDDNTGNPKMPVVIRKPISSDFVATAQIEYEITQLTLKYLLGCNKLALSQPLYAKKYEILAALNNCI